MGAHPPSLNKQNVNLYTTSNRGVYCFQPVCLSAIPSTYEGFSLAFVRFGSYLQHTLTIRHCMFYILKMKRLNFTPKNAYIIDNLTRAQLVTCLATDACLTADRGVASSIPARSHTLLEIGHEIFSTVIFLPSAEPFKNGGCCQLQAKACAQSTG